MHRLIALSSSVLLASGALAQTTASFTPYEAPCNGTPLTMCEVQNNTNPVLQLSTLNNEYGYAVLNTSASSIQVIGYRVWTQSITGVTETVNTGIYRDASGAGATTHSLPASAPEAVGLITADATAGWYESHTYPAVTVAPGEAFWLGQDCFNRVSPAHNPSVGSQVATSAWRRPPTVPNWALTGIVFNPIYEVLCLDGTPTAPTLSGTPPTLGGTFSTTVTGGDPNSFAFITYSFDNTMFVGMPTPVNLSIFGAPDCFAYSGGEIVTGIVLDPMGSGSILPFNVPNDPALDGVTWYNQGAPITSSGANALGLLFTNAGAAVVGI